MSAAPPADPAATLRSRGFAVLLVLSAAVGVLVSLAAWGFLEVVYELQHWLYTLLPRDLGYDDGPPLWWCLPPLAISGLVTGWAIVRLPGRGGHVPAEGLATSPTQPRALPGVILAALATLGLGVVLGPEAPLIALGAGLGILAVRLVRRDAPPPVVELLAAAGTFAALSLIFQSPLIAAVLLIEASGVGGDRLPLVLLPGLLAAGIGSLVSIGMGSWTGLPTSDYALGIPQLPVAAAPRLTDFAWTIALAVAVAVGAWVVVQLARRLEPVLGHRPLLALPPAALAIGGLAIAFQQLTDKGVGEVLFSGESGLEPLVEQAGTWSLSALALLIAGKGLAWAISLGGFRGGPTFPAIFLGAAAGLMAAQLPGFALSAAVAVGMGAAVVAVLGLPLAAVVLAVVLTSTAGAAVSPLIIVGVVVAHLTTIALTRPPAPAPRR